MRVNDIAESWLRGFSNTAEELLPFELRILHRFVIIF
jgi:hypothetical protein